MPARHPSPEALLGRISTRLRFHRKRARLTQEQLAERAGIQAETISRLETGKQQPSLGMVARLQQALEVPFGALLDDVPSHDGLSMVHQELLERFDGLHPDVQQGILQVLRGFQPH